MIGGLVGQVNWLLGELGVRMDKGEGGGGEGRQLALGKQGRMMGGNWWSLVSHVEESNNGHVLSLDLLSW